MVAEPGYYIGTSGFSYPHWRGVFYPQKYPQARWLEYYARHFRTVELNNPFYRLPSEGTFQGWQERTPPGFVFAVKASRLITHLHRLRGVEEALETFFSRVCHLGEKLGPILYQLPPGMGQDLELLDGFLSRLPHHLQHVMEYRNPTWYDEATLAVMRRHNVAFCVHDMARKESPVVATADFAYFRFHGPTGRYAGNYSSEQLARWAGRIRELGDGLKATYIYFNNDIGGHAIDNARTLAHLLQPGRAP